MGKGLVLAVTLTINSVVVFFAGEEILECGLKLLIAGFFYLGGVLELVRVGAIYQRGVGRVVCPPGDVDRSELGSGAKILQVDLGVIGVGVLEVLRLHIAMLG